MYVSEMFNMKYMKLMVVGFVLFIRVDNDLWIWAVIAASDTAATTCFASGKLIEVRAAGVCRSDWHAWQGHDPDIKSLVIHSSYHESGSDEYMHFFLFECPERHAGFSNSMSRYELHRFCNIIDP